MSRCTLFVLALAVARGQAQTPVLVESRFPTPDIPIAQVVLDPAADTVPQGTDDTPRLQAAVDQLADVGGGVVFLRAGEYRLRVPLTLKSGVTLRGEWAPPGHPLAHSGTRLLVYSGRGDEDGLPALMLHRNSALREVLVHYPEQDPTAPVPYSWTIASDPGWYEDAEATNRSLEMCQSVQRVTLVNPWRGIRIGPEHNAQFYVDQVYASPLRTGLQWDMVIDIGRVYGTYLAPEYWIGFGDGASPMPEEQAAALRAWMLEYADGLDCGRHDWGYVYDVHFSGLRAGILLHPGSADQIPTNAVIFGSSFTGCRFAVDSRSVSRFGLLATGCEFEGLDAAVRKAPDKFGVIQFNTCVLRSEQGPILQMLNDTEDLSDLPAWQRNSGYVSFQNCELRSWQGSAVVLDHGNFTASDCEFAQEGPHVTVGAQARSLHLVSNRFVGTPSLETTDASPEFDLVVDHTPREFARPDTSLVRFPPEGRPVRQALYVATELGVSEDAHDNTAALQTVLDRAGAEGGGTVYLPAGLYAVRGSLRVRSGVELRGCFEAPHQPLTPGTCLLAYVGRDDAEGEPFLSLEADSGLRGLTVFYPEQVWHDVAPRPYSWTVRALGDRVWLTYVTLGNAWQGVDLWTHGSDGHFIKYLGGAFFRKGVWISKTRGNGYVRDIQSNAHNTIWTDTRLNQRAEVDWDLLGLKHQQMSHLEFLVLGSCDHEQTVGTFTYCAGWGLSLREDPADPERAEGARGPNGRFIHHGTDLSRHAFHVQAGGGGRIQFINNEMTPRAYDEVGGIVVEESFTGHAEFFNNASWARGRAVADLRGPGQVTIQQLNNFSGPLRVDCATAWIDSGYHQQFLAPQVYFGPRAGAVRITGQTLAVYNNPRVWTGDGEPASLDEAGNSSHRRETQGGGSAAQ